MENTIRKKILSDLSRQAGIVESKKNISETKRITKIIQIYDAIDEIEALSETKESKHRTKFLAGAPLVT